MPVLRRFECTRDPKGAKLITTAARWELRYPSLTGPRSAERNVLAQWHLCQAVMALLVLQAPLQWLPLCSGRQSLDGSHVQRPRHAASDI